MNSITAFISKPLKKYFAFFILSTALVPSISSAQYQEELADFQASLFYLRFQCGVDLTEDQAQTITLNYIYQRRLFIDYIDSIAQEKLNVERYRDILSIEIPEKEKCNALKAAFAPSIEAAMKNGPIGAVKKN